MTFPITSRRLTQTLRGIKMIAVLSQTTESLEDLIVELVSGHSKGMTHVQLVREIHEHGFDAESAEIHQMVQDMARQKIIRKNLDTRMIRIRKSR